MVGKHSIVVGLVNLLLALCGTGIGCHAQLPYDAFCEKLLQHDLTVAESIIDGSVHAYFKQYYHMPKSYDDLVAFVSNNDRGCLMMLCDSLLYKNRQLITFIPDPDSSAMLYSGKIVFGLSSQYTCRIMLKNPVSIGVHMVDTGGQSCYNDSIVFVIKKLILPTVYKKAQATMCRSHHMAYGTNTIPCSIPYQYNVNERALSVADDCKKNKVKTCRVFDSILETELGKYDFSGITIITFPVNLYLEE